MNVCGTRPFNRCPRRQRLVAVLLPMLAVRLSDLGLLPLTE
jgi:hypothetical protein